MDLVMFLIIGWALAVIALGIVVWAGVRADKDRYRLAWRQYSTLRHNERMSRKRAHWQRVAAKARSRELKRRARAGIGVPRYLFAH